MRIHCISLEKNNIGIAPEHTHHCFGGMFGKRRQYDIRPRIAMTIHKAMGSDFGQIISSVCHDGINGFRLWDKAQVIVLLSRVHTTQNLIFVGNNIKQPKHYLKLSCYNHHMPYTRIIS